MGEGTRSREEGRGHDEEGFARRCGAHRADQAEPDSKGRHPAALNFGDCFAYACARHAGISLLYKGEDFPLTDIAPA